MRACACVASGPQEAIGGYSHLGHLGCRPRQLGSSQCHVLNAAGPGTGGGAGTGGALRQPGAAPGPWAGVGISGSDSGSARVHCLG